MLTIIEKNNRELYACTWQWHSVSPNKQKWCDVSICMNIWQKKIDSTIYLLLFYTPD